MRLLPVAAAAVAVLLLAGCQHESTPTDTPASTAQPGDGGPPTVQPLDWSAVKGPTTTAVTSGGEWTLTLPESGRAATLDGPHPQDFTAPDHSRISETLLDGEHAVVVVEDDRAQRPDVATVVDLASGDTFTVDGDTDVPTTTGGTWALGEGRLLHATVDADGAYCLAEMDLAERSSSITWCAPKRHGFNDVRVTAAGTTVLSFDDQQPSCRTIGEVRDEELAPLSDVEECLGWDALLLDGGAVWSTVPKPRRIEEATFAATGPDGTVDLGPGTSGSLVACGGSAYFIRDPQRSGQPARLMRWDGEVLTVAYETRGRGNAFLSVPRCGGDTITLTALGESGDEQVTAPAQ